MGNVHRCVRERRKKNEGKERHTTTRHAVDFPFSFSGAKGRNKYLFFQTRLRTVQFATRRKMREEKNVRETMRGVTWKGPVGKKDWKSKKNIGRRQPLQPPHGEELRSHARRCGKTMNTKREKNRPSRRTELTTRQHQHRLHATLNLQRIVVCVAHHQRHRWLAHNAVPRAVELEGERADTEVG